MSQSSAMAGWSIGKRGPIHMARKARKSLALHLLLSLPAAGMVHFMPACLTAPGLSKAFPLLLGHASVPDTLQI